MAVEDDHLESGHAPVEYSDLDDSALDLNITSGDPPPYHDDVNEDVHSKLLGPLPSYEDVQTEDSRRSFIKTTIISVITVLICVFIITSVFLYFLFDAEVPTVPKNLSPKPGSGQGPSQDSVLNFVKEYPKLKLTTTFECRLAWNRLIEIPCHRSMWMRDWDDGGSQISGPSLDQLLPLVCDQRCTIMLLEAQKTVGSACAGQRAFIVDEYSGTVNSKLLQAGPAKVIDELVEKIQHICRKPSNNEADTGFCLNDLQSQWGIFDGFRSDGLAGLERFLSATSIPRKEVDGLHQGTPQTHEASRSFPNLREERRFGPSKKSTTCSWCTLKWFEEKLGMWDNKKMPSWALPRFLRNWEEAGKRCEGDYFYEIFNAAVRSYKDAGLLEESWDHLPSGNISYLVAHGPTRGDIPVSWSWNIIPTVKKHRSSYPKTSASQRIKHAALNDEYVTCLEAFGTAGQDLPCYPFLDFPGIKEHILSSPQIAEAACSETCFTAISTFAQTLWDACPAARFARWDVYDNNLPAGLKYTLGFNLPNYLSDHGTMGTYQAACNRAVGRDGIPCGAIYAKWGKEEWIFSENSPKPKDLIRITRQQLRALPLMPKELKDLKLPTDRPMVWQDHEDQAELAAWRTKMDAGICSYCMWRQYVPYKATVEMIQSTMPHPAWGDEVLMEWIKTVHLMRSECQAHGIEFPEQELADIDVAWTQKHSQALLDEALREGRQEPDWVA